VRNIKIDIDEIEFPKYKKKKYKKYKKGFGRKYKKLEVKDEI
jgi:hypothetical protein